MYRIITLAAVMAVLIQSGCQSHHETEKEIIHYTSTSPYEIDTSLVKEYVAQVQSVQNIEIRAQERGYLQKIYVDEGQLVKKGQLLFKIMPNLMEAEADKANAEVKAAEIELQNTEILTAKNIVSPNELVVAKARLQQAKAGQRLANTHLGFTDITAPFSGILNRIPKKQGSLIDEGELLTSLSDNSQLFVYFNVSEPEYITYIMNKDKPGFKEVELRMANNQVYPDKGMVETVEGEFNPETGTIAFRARFPNPQGILRNGETGKIMMRMPIKSALVIPQKATYEIQDKKYVFLLGEDGKLSSKNIQVIAQIPHLYIISNDISVHDKILLEGIQTVKDDQKVEARFVDPKVVLGQLHLKAE